MSAIGGIYNFGGRVIDHTLLDALGNLLSASGPDGGTQLCVDSVGMEYRAFHTNRESRLEVQPYVSEGGQVLAWNGRLDNREELLALLGEQISGFPTDAAIVSCAYSRWGSNFLQRLIGDFSLSLWDPAVKLLLLARDPVGTRTLYYHRNSSRLIWSSDLQALLEVDKIPIEIDDDYVAGFLALGPEPSLTPYKGIYAVAPGHVLRVGNGPTDQERFWKLDPKKEIHYRKDEEYEQHFQELFREAVRCRLRSDRPVWAELSGGLDSSSIVCVADQIIGNGEAQTTKLEPVSFVFDVSSKSDERKFIHYVEQQRGGAGYYIRESDCSILEPGRANDDRGTLPNPLKCFAAYHRKLIEQMQASGGRVLLSGQGGDQVTNSALDPSSELADLLVLKRFLLLHERLTLWSRRLKKPYAEVLWQSAVLPTLPRKLQAISLRKKNPNLLKWLDKSFVERTNLNDRILGPTDEFGFRLPSAKSQASGFLSEVKIISAAYRLEFGNIEISYPFLHRPLVEFMQAIPFEQRVRPGETRSLMRRALRNILPAQIVSRKSKANPGEALYRGVQREWRDLHTLLTNSHICARGYANSKELLAALDRARYGIDLTVMPAIHLEFWLRSLEYRRLISKELCTASESATALRSVRVHHEFCDASTNVSQSIQ